MYLGFGSELSVLIHEIDMRPARSGKFIFKILTLRFLAPSLLFLLGNIFIEVAQTVLKFLIRT